MCPTIHVKIKFSALEHWIGLFPAAKHLISSTAQALNIIQQKEYNEETTLTICWKIFH